MIIFPLGPLVLNWGHFEFLRKFLGDIRNFVFDTGDKLFTGVNDTGVKLSPVSLFPVIVNAGVDVTAVTTRFRDKCDKIIFGNNDSGDS
jgi:hypothetical protein